jgi:hypothetical protein
MPVKIPDFRPSVVARDRSALRRDVSVEVEHDLVDVAPAPVFRRIVAFDDRVSGLRKMRAGMAVGRLVAATDVTATPAQPKMDPGRSDGQAFLATEGTGNHCTDGVQMTATC